MFDVAIIGGGLNGITLASILARDGIKVVLIDQNLLTKRLSNRQDGRGIAVARFSKSVLEDYGIWQCFKTKYGTINKIIVADGEEPFLMKLDNDLVDSKPLGYIIEHDDLLQQLYKYAIECANLTILDNTQLVNFEANQSKVTLELSNNKVIYAKLLVAADGKNSSIKKKLNIASTTFEYNQNALVFTIKHQKKHNNVAYEHFYPSGPFAILPLKDQHMSSVVWTERTEAAKIFANMEKEEISFFLQQKCQLTHGNVEISSKVFSYPLSLVFAHKYYDQRTVLIGDSLHFIHPIAGQGFNLSLRDINYLANLIFEYNNLGLDIGSETLLANFMKGRKVDNYAMIIFTDILNRSFSNNSKILSYLRKIGLSLVDLRPSWQKFFINYTWSKKLGLSKGDVG
jgi:2-octaprenyl-6-methoxyphenol hydroxylase